ALKGRRKLAGGGTAGMPVVIALRPCRGAGSERREKKLRRSTVRPAPRQRRDRSAISFRFKTIFDDRLQTRRIDNQFKELLLKSAIWNRITRLEMPDSVKVAG